MTHSSLRLPKIGGPRLPEVLLKLGRETVYLIFEQVMFDAIVTQPREKSLVWSIGLWRNHARNWVVKP